MWITSIIILLTTPVNVHPGHTFFRYSCATPHTACLPLPLFLQLKSVIPLQMVTAVHLLFASRLILNLRSTYYQSTGDVDMAAWDTMSLGLQSLPKTIAI
jgi:hypothetical protein